MMNRTILVKILSVCVCLCHVCPASPCGGNPMRSLENFARDNGFDSSAKMLHFMRENTHSSYSSFMHEYRRYLDCMQMVQNGYFKRSTDYAIRDTDDIDMPTAVIQNENIKTQFTKRKRHVNDVKQNVISAKIDSTDSKLIKRHLLKSLIKRQNDASKQKVERVEPQWREEMKVQLNQILAGKLSSILKRLSLNITDNGSHILNSEPDTNGSNTFMDLHSGKR